MLPAHRLLLNVAVEIGEVLFKFPQLGLLCVGESLLDLGVEVQLGHVGLVRTLAILDVLAGTEPHVAVTILEKLHFHLKDLEVPESLNVFANPQTLQLAKVKNSVSLKEFYSDAVLIFSQIANVVDLVELAACTFVDWCEKGKLNWLPHSAGV